MPPDTRRFIISALEEFARELAPETDRVATAAYPVARQRVRDAVARAGIDDPGLLGALLTPLLAEPVAAGDAHAVVRSMPWHDFVTELDKLVANGALHRIGDGRYAPTPTGRQLLCDLRAAQAAAAEELWEPVADVVEALLPLADRLTAAAWGTGGTAYALMANAPDPADATAAHLLLSRVTALRYHRADAHAAAWAAAGLTAAQITAPHEGPLREEVERDANRRDGAAYAVLTAGERAAWLTGLRALPGTSATRS